MHHECEEEETIKYNLPWIDISVIAGISTALDKNIFSRMLTESGQLSRKKMISGATTANDSPYLVDDPDDQEGHMLKNSSSPFILISSLQRSITLSALLLSFLKIACLHVSFTAYENFYILSKMHCLLILFSTFSPSELPENRNSTIKHISTYTLFPSISTYVVDHFLVISCL